MKITVLGAAGEVTGSGYLVETAHARVLVDFGMFQGRGSGNGKNADIAPVVPHRLDAVVLTHGHLDHVGRGDRASRSGHREIHNGADDNASGAAAVLELARRLQARPAARDVVLAWFGAEEYGLPRAACSASRSCVRPRPLRPTALAGM